VLGHPWAPSPVVRHRDETTSARFKNKKSAQKLRGRLKRKAYRKGTKAKLKVTATDVADNKARERATVKLRP
jgi:hypothetical protein